MALEETVETVGDVLEVVGVAAIALGIAVSVVVAVVDLFSPKDCMRTYELMRRRIGRSILLGLEVLVGADIIRTVAADPTFTSVGVLAGIVLIRTFLSFTLEVELTGRWPWQKEQHEASGAPPES